MARYRTSVMVAEVIAGELDPWCAARGVDPSTAVAECLARWRARPGPALEHPGPRVRVQLRVDRDLVDDVRRLAAHEVVGLGAVVDSQLHQMMMQRPVLVDPRRA